MEARKQFDKAAADLVKAVERERTTKIHEWVAAMDLDGDPVAEKVRKEILTEIDRRFPI